MMSTLVPCAPLSQFAICFWLLCFCCVSFHVGTGCLSCVFTGAPGVPDLRSAADPGADRWLSTVTSTIDETERISSFFRRTGDSTEGLLTVHAMPDAPLEPELIDMPPAQASAPPMSNLERCIALRVVYGAGPR